VTVKLGFLAILVGLYTEQVIKPFEYPPYVAMQPPVAIVVTPNILYSFGISTGI